MKENTIISQRIYNINTWMLKGRWRSRWSEYNGKILIEILQKTFKDKGTCAQIFTITNKSKQAYVYKTHIYIYMCVCVCVWAESNLLSLA